MNPNKDTDRPWLEETVRNAADDPEDMKLILGMLNEHEETKQLLRKKGYGCTGRPLYETAEEVPEADTQEGAPVNPFEFLLYLREGRQPDRICEALHVEHARCQVIGSVLKKAFDDCSYSYEAISKTYEHFSETLGEPLNLYEVAFMYLRAGEAQGFLNIWNPVKKGGRRYSLPP